jgi:hypothetical protein
MEQPHPGARPRDRVCWLGGEPSWSRGQLAVRAANGEPCSLTVPRQVADDLRRCHPANWVDDKPPARSQLGAGQWLEPFRALGLVLV